MTVMTNGDGTQHRPVFASVRPCKHTSPHHIGSHFHSPWPSVSRLFMCKYMKVSQYTFGMILSELLHCLFHFVSECTQHPHFNPNLTLAPTLQLHKSNRSTLDAVFRFL